MSIVWQPRTPFLAGLTDRRKAAAVIIGAPMDWSSSFRPGSRFGPAAIREVSEAIEEYSPYAERALDEVAFYDAGDLVLPCGNVVASLAMVEEAVAEVLAEDKFPLLLGGEHLVTYGAIRAFYPRYPDLCLLHLDAHADLRPAYLGEELSHASVMRLVHGLLGDGRIFQCGIRSGDREEFVFARAHTRLYRGPLPAAVEAAVREIGERPLYVSLDIDVVDPAFAPGTGTPECAGATSGELLAALSLLRRRRVVGFDLVEVLPTLDLSARTSLLAAVVVREVLLQFVKT